MSQFHNEVNHNQIVCDTRKLCARDRIVCDLFQAVFGLNDKQNLGLRSSCHIPQLACIPHIRWNYY